MFCGCTSFISLSDISKWNHIMDISMFSECSSLISLPNISKWNANNMHISMFSGCLSLLLLPDIFIIKYLIFL